MMAALLLPSALPAGAAVVAESVAAATAGLEWTNPAGAWWLVATGGAAACLGLLARWRVRARKALADTPLLMRLAPGMLAARHGLRLALLVTCLGFLTLALLDPRSGGRSERVAQRGVDLMVVVDVSRSMLAEDAPPDRLSRARQFAADLVETLGSDRVGLIEFAGLPALRCPLTFNHRTFLTQLDTLSPQATVRGGSLLGDAIRLATASLAGDGRDGEANARNESGAIVVLSDGEDMESEPIEAAAQARERGIRVVTIGIGDASEGARIPIGAGTAKRYLVHEGQEVWSKMDPALLRRVAEAGGGFFVEAGAAPVDMASTAEAIRAQLAERELDDRDVQVKDPEFQWFAAFALMALLLECATLAPRRAHSGTLAQEGSST